MSHHPWPRLGDVLIAHYGKALKQEDRDQSGEAPVFGSSGQVGSHTASLTTLPTIILGRKGSVGALTWAPKGGWIIDTAYYLEIKEKQQHDLRYLFHAAFFKVLVASTIQLCRSFLGLLLPIRVQHHRPYWLPVTRLT